MSTLMIIGGFIVVGIVLAIVAIIDASREPAERTPEQPTKPREFPAIPHEAPIGFEWQPVFMVGSDIPVTWQLHPLPLTIETLPTPRLPSYVHNWKREIHVADDYKVVWCRWTTDNGHNLNISYTKEDVARLFKTPADWHQRWAVTFAKTFAYANLRKEQEAAKKAAADAMVIPLPDQAATVETMEGEA